MKCVAVVGLGKSGRSACRYLLEKGFEVWATDDKHVESLDPRLHFTTPAELVERLESFSFVLLSPGVPLTHQVVQRAKVLGLELFCDVEYALRELQSSPMPICGITGTNGKTTTTLLTCHMMNHAKRDAKTAGNIGNPILDVVNPLMAAPLVLELSSFQLQTMHTARLQAATVLNISPNHLDHHASMEEYAQAKLHIGELLVKEAPFFVHEAIPYSKRALRFGFQPSCDIYSDGKHIWRYGVKEEELPERLFGTFSHDMENFLAAYALCRHFGISSGDCMDAYAGFLKPPHRIQHVLTRKDVSFYDDSKATNVEAVLRAVESIQGPVVLIAGGVHKGHPYHAWKSAFREKVRMLFLIGQAAPIIEQDLAGTIPTQRCASLEEAVQRGAAAAQRGDTVLLSPGCSSYDMFSSYEERGKTFQKLVRNHEEKK